MILERIQTHSPAMTKRDADRLRSDAKKTVTIGAVTLEKEHQQRRDQQREELEEKPFSQSQNDSQDSPLSGTATGERTPALDIIA